MQKTSPRLTVGNWKIVYRQVPYDDRYFFIYYNGEQVAQIPCYIYEEHSMYILPKAVYATLPCWRREDFSERVLAHDNYLDSSDVI